MVARYFISKQVPALGNASRLTGSLWETVFAGFTAALVCRFAFARLGVGPTLVWIIAEAEIKFQRNKYQRKSMRVVVVLRSKARASIVESALSDFDQICC